MWLSLIWANENPPVAWRVVWPRERDEGTPPPIVQRSPVPAQAMHLRKPRRSTPSCPSWVSLEEVIRFLPESRPEARRTSGPAIRDLPGGIPARRPLRRHRPRDRIHRTAPPGLVRESGAGANLAQARRLHEKRARDFRGSIIDNPLDSTRRPVYYWVVEWGEPIEWPQSE